MMHKRRLIALLLALMLLLTACGAPMSPRGARITVDDWAEDIRDAVLEGIANKDRDIIREQFSVQALADTDDIERGIDYLFELVQGEIVEVENLTWGQGESIRYGKHQSTVRAWCDFTTTQGEYYLFLLANDWDDYNKDNMGLQSLRIVLIDENYPKHVTYWQDMQQPGIYAPTQKETEQKAAIFTDEYARIFIDWCKRNDLFVTQVRDYFSHEAIHGSFWFDLRLANVLYDDGALFALVDVGMYPEYKTNGAVTIEGYKRSTPVEAIYEQEHHYALLYDPANAPCEAVLEVFRGMSTSDEKSSWYDPETRPVGYGDFQDFYFAYGGEVYTEYELMSCGVLDENGVNTALLYVRENGQLLEGYPIELRDDAMDMFDVIIGEFDIQDWEYEYTAEERAADGESFFLAAQYSKTYIHSFGNMAYPDDFEQAKAKIIERFTQLQENPRWRADDTSPDIISN